MQSMLKMSIMSFQYNNFYSTSIQNNQVVRYCHFCMVNNRIQIIFYVFDGKYQVIYKFMFYNEMKLNFPN